MNRQILHGIFAAAIATIAVAGPGHGNSDRAEHEQQHEKMHDHHGGSHHGGGHHGMGHGKSLAGRPGKEHEVNRVVEVEANDTMRFVHEPLKVKTGETIKFEISNTGAIKHEFSIGTKDEHMAHGKMMMENPGMHHGPGGASITVEPGETETLIWTFEEAWEVQAACNIPGHYQAGMHSDVVFGE